MDHIEYCLEHTPKWRPVVPNGIDPCQAGMNAIHELGEVIAVCTAIIEDFCKRGHTIDEFGPMVVAMDAESDFFESIAKFRAARRMWAKVARERFGAQKKSTMMLKIGIRTSGLSLQAQKPLNNAARVTIQTLAGVLGGSELHRCVQHRRGSGPALLRGADVHLGYAGTSWPMRPMCPLLRTRWGARITWNG